MLDLDPEARASLVAQAKRHLRARLRALRGAVPRAIAAERDAAIVAQLLALPEWQTARGVALFASIADKRELDLGALDEAARRAGKRVHYPFMDPTPSGGFSTGFRRLDAPEALADHGRGFREPPRDAAEAQRGDIDLILVPALGATPEGDRLGYGAGWYDATLPDHTPPALRVIVVHEHGLLGELPRSERDVRCDVVVTEKRVLRGGATIGQGR